MGDNLARKNVLRRAQIAQEGDKVQWCKFKILHHACENRGRRKRRLKPQGKEIRNWPGVNTSSRSLVGNSRRARSEKGFADIIDTRTSPPIFAALYRFLVFVPKSASLFIGG